MILTTYQRYLRSRFQKNFRADEGNATALGAATLLMMLMTSLAHAWDHVSTNRNILVFADVGVIEELHNKTDVWKDSSSYCEDRISNLSS